MARRIKETIMSDIIDDDPTHSPGTPRGEDFAEPASETKGATDRPVGQVEGDIMDPDNANDHA